MTDEPLAARATAPDTDHIRGDRRLVDKHQPRRIKEPLLPNPTSARSRYVFSMSLGCAEAFFIGEIMTLEKPPERGSAARNPLLVHSREYFIQGPILVLGHQSKDPIRVHQDRTAAPARFRFTRSLLAPALYPPNR
jgi:hypothetical protein